MNLYLQPTDFFKSCKICINNTKVCGKSTNVSKLNNKYLNRPYGQLIFDKDTKILWWERIMFSKTENIHMLKINLDILYHIQKLTQMDHNPKYKI